ncbi:signal recognition particle receptor subunit alpha [Nanoarchaeota archaeon]
MVLEKIGNVLKTTIKKIADAIFVDKALIDSIIKDLRYSLLDADISLEVVQKLNDNIRKIATDKKSNVDRKDQLIALIHDEMVKLLGKEKYELPTGTKKPLKVMFLGLYGAGKTTTISKLAMYYTKRGFKTCAIGLDVHRPAAPEQLEQLGRQVKIPVFINKEEKNPIKIWEQYKNKLQKYDIVLIDTAGRDALEKSLIEELEKLNEVIQPDQKILVMSADIGQAAKKQASEFQRTVDIDGVIITRMDSTAKAGGALVACAETSAPVIFIGTGEKPQDIETFNPTAFVSRLLGMGDLEALLEKAKHAIEKEKAEEIEEKLKTGKFSLLEFFEQIKAMQNMGPMGKMMELIPGLGGAKLPEGVLDIQEKKMNKWKASMSSMTHGEINDPETITSARIARIAKGSGSTTADVKEMLNQFKLVKGFASKTKGMDISSMQNPQDLMKSMGGKQLRKLAKKFKGKMPF